MDQIVALARVRALDIRILGVLQNNFGANRLGAKVSQGMIDSFWLQGMQAGHKNTFDCIKAFSEMDFTENLKKFNVPALILHGDDDHIVPIGAAVVRPSKLVTDTRHRNYAENAAH